MANVSSPVRTACWATILDNVLNALAQAESEAALAATAIDAALATQATAPRHDPNWQTGLDALEEKINRLKDCAAQASRTAAEAEAALANSEESLRQWLAIAEAMRRKLAIQAPDSV